MSTLKKIGRALIILVTVLVIVLSAAGIYGAWYVNRTVTDITLKVFSVVDIGLLSQRLGSRSIPWCKVDGPKSSRPSRRSKPSEATCRKTAPC